MFSRYVSLAIDHGTTNSCIAHMTPDGPRVIPAEPDSPILPSVVYYDQKGGLRIGSAARIAMMTTDIKTGQGFGRYKLQIGDGDARYNFRAAGKSMTAPELGSVIIQSLLRAYYKASGEDAKACVITIPAKFKLNAVEGTRAAAEMAGLKYYPLIMEPVAAAMCYGFTAKDPHAQWMVFDLGGGTLDVSLVIARRGKLEVPEGGHAGDDNLGGAKFDRELAGYVLDELDKRYKLGGFRKNDGNRYSNEWGKLLLAVEDAKIKLSTLSESLVELPDPLCLDDQGREVTVKVPVTRKIYQDLIRPDVERAVQMCQMVIKHNRLEAKAVERLILVGGPSKTPLIRQMLAEQLGIPLESSVDPMTAVAEGAAIYADQVEIPMAWRATEAVASGAFTLRMQSDHQSPFPVYCAVGMVDGPSMDGLRVEIERRDGGWRSRQIEIDASGVFSAEVILLERDKPTLSEFRTTLLDARGKELACVDEPQIWYPSLAVSNRLANSLRVALKGNRAELLLEPGAELPAEKTGYYRTAKALRKGDKEDVLRVAVLESVTHQLGKEDDQATGCLHVGTLRILGSDVRVTADIPAGTEIEVRLKVDESRAIRAIAYIPMIDEEFETSFVGENFEYKLEDLPNRIERVNSSLDDIAKVQAEKPRVEVGEILANLGSSKLVESVLTDLERAKAGDKESEVRAYKRILELEGTVRALQRLQHRARIEMAVGTLGGVVKGNEQTMLLEIQKEYSGAETDEDLDRCLASVEGLEFTVRGRPWQELLLDVIALGGVKVNSHQHALFNQASELLERVQKKGGIAKATDADIAEMTRMHSQLQDAYNNLYELRRKALDEMGKGKSGPLDITDLESARK